MASVDYLVKGLASLTDTGKLLREISSGMLAETRTRIHNYGERATGAPIGQYSDNYLKLRIDSGKGSDRSVIFSLTGQMENNYKVIAISDTEYGLGFDNATDGQKSVWLAERFGNDIWALSESELEQVDATIQEFVNNAFK